MSNRLAPLEAKDEPEGAWLDDFEAQSERESFKSLRRSWSTRRTSAMGNRQRLLLSLQPLAEVEEEDEALEGGA